MNWPIITTVAKHFFRHKFMARGMLLLLSIYLLALGWTSYERWHAYEHQIECRHEHQHHDRESWESNPDKHPHRMAHFGAFAFRLQHPLSIFDAGLESYMGNVIYLEAHKQNTANFSEASLSTGLIRFGDLHVAMLLYLILPLFIFFIGFDAITREREGRTLKLMYVQGAELRDIICGKVLGLWAGAALFFVPALCLMWSLLLLEEAAMGQEVLGRLVVLTLVYLVFFLVLCLFTVLVSAWSKGSTQALLSLLGCWLLLFVVVPKVSQTLGASLSPAPSKLAFKRAVEEDVLQVGNSHNPNDPYFKGVKDSLLRAYGVETVEELPFNFAGYIMGLGEQITSDIHAGHQRELTETYRRQNTLARGLSLVNPYLAMREVSMAFSGTDFNTYHDYLLQAERYRYDMAMHMAELQKELVRPNATGGTEGKKNAISREHFHRFPEFSYSYQSLAEVLRQQWFPLLSLALMLTVLLGITWRSSQLFSVS